MSHVSSQPDHAQALIHRLEAIGRTLRDRGDGLALLALGSSGLERNRIDAYSDLDFFAIVKPESVTQYLGNLDWLEASGPIVYSFKNTVDGYKTMYADGILCEFAVFEPAQLANIPYPPAAIVWAADEFDPTLATPVIAPKVVRTQEWLIGEALTNLFVGLGRFRRGEKLTAMRFVQMYALDRVIELADQIEPAATNVDRDLYLAERRIEQRLPGFAPLIPNMTAGYEQTPTAAVAILDYLETHFEINAYMSAKIRQLAASEFPSTNR